jgi:hypothetical protein
VDFSEAEDLFVIIFRILDQTGKIRDCVLISDKLRGLNEKWLGYLISELISNRKCRGLGPWLVDQRRGGRSTGPPWPTARLAGAWPSGRSGPRRLAARVETGRVQRGATGRLLTRARTTVRRRRASDGGSAGERARRGSAGEQEKAREREEKVWEWPGVLGGFYRGQGRHRGGVMAGNRRCKWR